jgi:glycosyltransferase involved in cell wall biosynthesis
VAAFAACQPARWYALSPRRLRHCSFTFAVYHRHDRSALGKAHGIPVVFTFHTLYHRYLHYVPAPSAWTRSYIVWWVRQYCGLCSHIIAPEPSRGSGRWAAATRSSSQRHPDRIDVARFVGGQGERLRAEYGLTANDKVLLYVGRLVREKNLEFLLRALAPLLREYSNPCLKLLLVGGGPALDLLRELSRELDIVDNVIFTGFVAPERTPDFYAAADLFVFASRTETQGVSIAEALAAGLPCVVVGAMGAAEAITDGVTGWSCRLAKMSSARLSSDCYQDESLRHSMSRQALLKAPALSQKHSVEQLLALYRSLIAPNH